jgi:hypothetical protein
MDTNTNLDLDYILAHFSMPIWPRTISTKTLEGRQLLVYSREEALARFAQANWLDCRVSAYPPNAQDNPSDIERYQGITRITPRNLVVIIDLDKSTFKSDKVLQLALSRILQNIKSVLDVEPTVIWSGNGYHIYLVLDSNGIILENVKQLTDLKIDQISLKFLRFTESFLSYGRSDKQHNTTVSFNNCMMRIPGSFNSKNNCQVRLIQRWNPICKRPAINYLLADFVGYLVNEKAQPLIAVAKDKKRIASQPIHNNDNPQYINWIEQLIQTPMPEHRKFVVWMILPQYLINIRKMTYEQSNNKIKNWLDGCDKLRRLDSIAIKQKLRDGFEAAQKGFRPISREKLKIWKPELASLLLTA